MALQLPPGTAKLWNGTKNLGGASIDSMSALARTLFGAGKGSGGFAASAVGGVVSKTGSVVDGSLGVAGALVNRIGNGVRRFPKASAVLGLGVAGMAVKGYYDGKRMDATEEMAFKQAQANPYMGSVTPQEYAAMEARLRGANPVAGGFAANVQAERAAAAAGSEKA